MQISNSDEGVLEIYAEQQDAFVRLTLEQINLLGDHSEEKIISDILGTLDASSGRYWTLSRNSTMIFVKDIAETNSYMGFSDKTYYVSDSAKEFIDGLTLNRVVHRMIEQSGDQYVASGTVFQYNSQEYAICLLTNREIILDNNQYLNARINLTILLIFFLALFIATVIFTTLRFDKLRKEKRLTEESNRTLRTMAERLNSRLEKRELYDTSLSVFDKELLPEFLEKLRQRKIYPYTCIRVSFTSAKERKLFLQASQLSMRLNVVRFSDGSNLLFLVGVRMTSARLVSRMEVLFPRGMTVEERVDIESEEDEKNLYRFL